MCYLNVHDVTAYQRTFQTFQVCGGKGTDVHRLVDSLQCKNGTHSGVTTYPYLVKSVSSWCRDWCGLPGTHYVGNVRMIVFTGGGVSATDSAEMTKQH